MNRIFRWIVYCLLLISFSVKAQENRIDSALNNFKHYVLQNQNSAMLFVHFDKNVYTTNDNIWFTGYLIKSRVQLDQHSVLYLSLVKNKDNSVVYQDKFLIDNGFAFGSFKIPDSIASGNYRFIVNTNIKLGDRPEMEFVQPIVLKSFYIDALVPSANLQTEFDEKTGNGVVLLKTMTNNLRFVENAEVEYTVSNGNSIIKRGKLKTNTIGEALINYPHNQLSEEGNFIDFKITKEQADQSLSDNSKPIIVRNLKYNIPKVKKLEYSLSFFPEGGYLVEGLKSKVGLELKDSENNLVSGSIVILENSIPLDTLKSNSLGLASFLLTPKTGNIYTAKLLDEKISKQIFKFPKVLNDGCVLTLTDAVANSDLITKIKVTKSQNLTFIVHNYREIFAVKTIFIDANKDFKIRFELNDIPMGINTLTVLDSLNRPVSERLFFANYNKMSSVKIDLDTIDFKPRDKVNAFLSIGNLLEGKIKGLVSVACVRADKVSALNSQNIIDYVYLDGYLNGLPQHPMGVKLIDKNYLEDVLLIKYWRRYKWPESISLNENKSINEYKFTGKVFKGTSPIKESKELALITGGNFSNISTDENGFFLIKDLDIIKDKDKKIILAVTGEKGSAYTFKLNEPLDSLKNYLAKSNFTDNYSKISLLNETSLKSGISDGIKLQDVTIRKSKNSDSYPSSIRINPCGDYVCSNNILNCENHFGDAGNKLPIKGNSYISFLAGRGSKIIYSGCEEVAKYSNFKIQLITGINLPKDFYVFDIKDKNEPLKFETVYWNYQLPIKADGLTPLSFYTGDLTGDFKIIVQGLTENGFVYGEKVISVNK